MERLPIILYTMPRSNGTALLFASDKINKISSLPELVHDTDDISGIFPIIDKIPEEEWNNTLLKINDPNTILRIFSYELFSSRKMRLWFESCEHNKTHNIFVLERKNLMDMSLSAIIARRFGYIKHKEILPFAFDADENDVMEIKFNIYCYMAYMPKTGKLINIENYPTEHFSNVDNVLEKQNSSSKFKYINNLDWIREKVQDIIDFYQPDIDYKTSFLEK
jgi:hypothetical protein